MSRFSEPNSFVMEPSAPANPAERMAVILAELTPTQAEAAMLQGAVLVLAGAGTGEDTDPDRRRGIAHRRARYSALAHPGCDLHQQGHQGDGGPDPQHACGCRRGFTRPSCFIEDIPSANRVAGWLHSQSARSARPVGIPSGRSPNWIAWNCCAGSNPTESRLVDGNLLSREKRIPRTR